MALLVSSSRLRAHRFAALVRRCLQLNDEQYHRT